MDDDVVASLREQAPAASRASDALPRPRRARRAAGGSRPYYGGPEGFDEVIDLVEEGSRVLLERVEASAPRERRARRPSRRPSRRGAFALRTSPPSTGEVLRVEVDKDPPSPSSTRAATAASRRRRRPAHAGRLRGARPRVEWAGPHLLLMDWCPGDTGVAAAAAADAARGLRRLHAAGELPFGLASDARIGGLHQPNAPEDSWLSFFAEHRLVAFARAARDEGRLDASGAELVERVASRLVELAAEPATPALLHGDLWAGNVLTGGGVLTAFLDPLRTRPPRGGPRLRDHVRRLPAALLRRLPRARGGRGADGPRRRLLVRAEGPLEPLPAPRARPSLRGATRTSSCGPREIHLRRRGAIRPGRIALSMRRGKAPTGRRTARAARRAGSPARPPRARPRACRRCSRARRGPPRGRTAPRRRARGSA